MPSAARMSNGIAAAKRNTIRTSYELVQTSMQMNEEGEKTNIELVEGGETNDNVRIRAFCLDVAKEGREADENRNEENVGRRRGQGTDEKDPGVDLDGVSERRILKEKNGPTVTMLLRETRVVSGMPRMAATQPRQAFKRGREVGESETDKSTMFCIPNS
jgi:hypothetical protein